ncbi:MAG: endolytic transglycosylase MltG [Chloroflexi bacterium]|nr:MAG: endolytic transglycosylase MltG [Chloroflexota bacterium]
MKRRGSRAAIIAVLLLGLLIFGIVYFTWTTVTDVFQPANANATSTKPFVINSGESGAQIADALQENGLIRNALAFRIWARIKGLDTQLQAGAYNLSPSMTIDQIIALLLHAQPDAVPVTVLEGWRLEEIANKFAHNDPAYPPLTKFNEQDFLKYVMHPNLFPGAANFPILKDIPPGNSMEGFLFPDTYLIPVNGTAQDVITTMLKEFTSKVQQNHLDTLAKQNKLSVYQMVILASIVQREAAETVSELDADPTVQYARDSQPGTKKYWTPLQAAGRLVLPTSPWNTYTHAGFPPTPICSPGLASLMAAAAPPTTQFYFFLSKPDGHNVYAKTNAEFIADEQKYLSH